VITKGDLLPHVRFDLEEVRRQVGSLNPTGRLLITSATTGEGIDAWCDLLVERMEAKRAADAAPGP
jgi:hydrogenase nickel incorporation protein HypB